MKEQLTLNFRLRDDATFDNYIGSAASKLREAEHLTFLYGSPGSGKSHLLQALCHETAGSSIYLEDLGSHQADILHSLENISLICLDDIDDVIAMESWQIALFNLVNYVKDGSGRLIIAANKPASAIDCTLPDLATRLNAMVAIESELPTDSEKLAILTRRAHQRGFELNDEVARFILGRAPRNPGHLIKLLEKLEVETLRQQKIVTISFVKKTLQL